MEECDWGPIPFRFYDNWLHDKKLNEVVDKQLKARELQGASGRLISLKLKNVKRSIKEVINRGASSLRGTIKSIEARLNDLDIKAASDQLSADERKEKRTLWVELWKVYRMEESMWRQKLRVKWLRDGDKKHLLLSYNCELAKEEKLCS